jgi:hypothetical protein
MNQRTAVSLILTLMVSAVSAYKKGPPVAEHPDICGSMSPKEGHLVESENRTLPFALTIVSTPGDCYVHNKPVTVKLATINNKTWFEGFLLQARQASSLTDNHQPLQLEGLLLEGTFDTNGDSDLQTLTCGDTSHKNALGHRTAKHYFEKTFKWTPANSAVTPIQLIATVVHEKDEYWMRVTSPVLQRCNSSACSPCAFSSALALVVSIAAGLLL